MCMLSVPQVMMFSSPQLPDRHKKGENNTEKEDKMTKEKNALGFKVKGVQPVHFFVKIAIKSLFFF